MGHEAGFASFILAHVQRPTNLNPRLAVPPEPIHALQDLRYHFRAITASPDKEAYHDCPGARKSLRPTRLSQ